MASHRPEHEPGRKRARDLAAAQCAGCPVRALCLLVGLEAGEEHGIWGGVPGREIKDLRSTLDHLNRARSNQDPGTVW